VAVGDFAVRAESCVVVEPGGADLGEAQGRPERPGDAPGEAGVDGAAVAGAGGGVLAQEGTTVLAGVAVGSCLVPVLGRWSHPAGSWPGARSSM